MAKVTAADREKRRDEKYGVSVTISVGPLFSSHIAIGMFDLAPRPTRLQVNRRIEAAGELTGDHKKLPNRATVLVTERNDLLDRSSDGLPPTPGRYRIMATRMHVELWLLPNDLVMIGSTIGKAGLEIHMVIDPPAKGLRQVRSSFFKLGSIENEPVPALQPDG